MDPRFELLIFDEKNQMTVGFIRKLLQSMRVKGCQENKSLDEYSYIHDEDSVSITQYLHAKFGFDFYFRTHYPEVGILEKELCMGSILSDISYHKVILLEYERKAKEYNFNDPNCLRPCFEILYYILTHFSGEVSIMFIHHDNYLIGWKDKNNAKIEFLGNDKLYFNETLIKTFNDVLSSKNLDYFIINEKL
jgi:hypothetical protein